MCVIRMCYNYIMGAKGVEGKRLRYRDFMSGLQVCGPRPRTSAGARPWRRVMNGCRNVYRRG